MAKIQKFSILIIIAVLLLATGHFLFAQDEATSTPAVIETTSTLFQGVKIHRID